MNKSDVLIKWTGTKRSQAKDIVQYFPKNINTYFESFAGSCSILWEVLNTSDIKVEYYICSDINENLINLWKNIKDNPYKLSSDYRNLWNDLNNKNEKDRNNYWYKIRDQFNKFKDPSIFLFLNRTCYNGLIRYNSIGEFNTSYHFSRKGIDPETLHNIILKWHKKLVEKNVIFNYENYVNIISEPEDFMYFDPPYSKSDSMYYGKIDLNEFFTYLSNLKCKWILSFDGFQNDISNIYNIPKDLYKKHILIESGNSSFSKLKGNNVSVKESIYLNF